ncbi:MAG: aminotransferase class I/II-fold pyridoxal phosphate-dependent enzyme [Rhodospirillales bacterium]|nr:aminotransferase class I/II-fold pyridoxal phosphate-dependent enzyme [Rhodospirillales bacterium]MDH3916887.1 aminotransferase class I/II-fold pyridoxal phosphate-dependent enzyme [Rhodospirillales bacterium]MDH3968066.1 aminotransferase class I/II-fold pyridoxal phosphate-dependent enzyme [Rhodospirillales bacterium]
MTDHPDLQAYYPFSRLGRLLDGLAPGRSPADDGAPILLSIGEPQHQPPKFVAEEIARHAAGWSRYPPARGTEAYREAATAWLLRRYGLPPSAAATGGMLDPARALLPLPGTREGLFFAALATIPRSSNGQRPVVLIPNPFYHVYAGAALAAGAEPVFVRATRETGFLPDFAALDPALLERTAYCTLCSPSNPQGAAASLEQLQELITLARRHDFVVAFDECYAELYNDRPPTGAVEAAAALDGSLDRMLVFHSLSKRSSAPGLRCGFAVGEPGLVDALGGVLQVGGAGVPLPTLAAGTRLWQEQDHVERNRAHYRANFAVAERVLGNRFGFRKPDGGFFLWLEVGDGEAAAVELWRSAGIKVLPGAYMCAEDEGGENPGNAYIRVALVYDRDVTEAALGRIGEVL